MKEKYNFLMTAVLKLNGLGFHGVYLDDNDFSDLSLKEHVELYLDDGLSEKEAIKRVAFERKIQKSIVYKEYHLNK